MARSAPMLTIAMVAFLVAGGMTDDQAERCAEFSEAVTLAKAKAIAEDSEGGVSAAQDALRRCLDYVAENPLTPVQRRARRRCPCTEMGVSWNDAEGEACRFQLEQYYGLIVTYDANRVPVGDQIRTYDLRGHIDQVRTCVESFRTQAARRDEAAREAEAQRERAEIDARAHAAAPPTPSPPAEPTPRKITARERKAAAEARAAREAGREEAAGHAARAADQRRTEACGPAPGVSGWDGLPVGLKAYFKRMANDPDSVEFVACTAPRLLNPPICWGTVCDVRAKNALGAKLLKRMAFGKSASGWSTVVH